MTIRLIHFPQPVQVADGIYTATITSIEPNIPSRYSTRNDLIRFAFDLHIDEGPHRPRLWLTTPPILRGRLESLLQAVLGRTLSDQEAETFDIEGLLGCNVGIVVAQGTGRSGLKYPRIVSFAPSEKQSDQEPLSKVLADKDESKDSDPTLTV